MVWTIPTLFLQTSLFTVANWAFIITINQKHLLIERCKAYVTSTSYNKCAMLKQAMDVLQDIHAIVPDGASLPDVGVNSCAPINGNIWCDNFTKMASQRGGRVKISSKLVLHNLWIWGGKRIGRQLFPELQWHGTITSSSQNIPCEIYSEKKSQNQLDKINIIIFKDPQTNEFFPNYIEWIYLRESDDLNTGDMITRNARFLV